MATPLSQKRLLTHATEIVTGRLFAGAITNGDYDITLGPGFWHVQLFVNANTVSAGTLAAYPLDGDDNPLSEEPFGVSATGTTVGVTVSLIDLVGPVYISQDVGETNVSPVSSPLGIYNKLRLTIASIAGAGATNRIDYIAQRIS